MKSWFVLQEQQFCCDIHAQRFWIKKSCRFAANGFFVSGYFRNYFDYGRTAPRFFGIIPDFYFYFSEKNPQGILKCKPLVL